MVSLRQKKKQNPAKRAWKSFTNMVKSKLRDIEIAATVRESTARVIRFLSCRLIVPFRTRYLENTSYSDKYYRRSSDQTSSRRFLNFFSRSQTKTKRRSYAYDDDDYSQFYQHQNQSRFEGTSEISKEKVVRRKEEKAVRRREEKEEDEEGMPEIADSMEDAWRRVVAASPHLRVDERADEFIYKFRESMKMEKERSFLEFQERLKRSA
ncbi:Cotton fiber protein [Hirschfeldia incana]|nr:Cotton fiber protein [Hirschfeldia incana]